MTRQEEIKKGLFDVLNSCPKENCENDDPDECIRCDATRVLEYLHEQGVKIVTDKINSYGQCFETAVEPLINKETSKQDV